MGSDDLLRDGIPLRIKGSLTDFSYFPSIKTDSGPVTQSKAYTTDAWSLIHASVRLIKDRTIRESAVPFAEQSHEFYSAALANSTVRAKPLLLYYAFLNLAKALCLCRGNMSVIGAAQHGLSEYTKSGASLKAAKVLAHPSKPTAVNMFDEFIDAVEGTRLKTRVTYRVHDLIACSLIGHRLWCEAIHRPDCFLKITPIEILHNKDEKQIWLRAGMRRGVRTRAGVAEDKVASAGFDDQWKLVEVPDDYVEDTHCWEQITPLKYIKKPAEKLEELAAFARGMFYRSLTVAEPFRHYYIYVPRKNFKKHKQMASRYVLLYFLGSVTRYHPADFEEYMSSEFGPFLAEFLASEPSQMLFEMACLFTRREVVSVGLA